MVEISAVHGSPPFPFSILQEFFQHGRSSQSESHRSPWRGQARLQGADEGYIDVLQGGTHLRRIEDGLLFRQGITIILTTAAEDHLHGRWEVHQDADRRFPHQEVRGFPDQVGRCPRRCRDPAEGDRHGRGQEEDAFIPAEVDR